jgi:protein phosphatase
MNADSAADTGDHGNIPDPSLPRPSVPSAAVAVRVGAKSHPGSVRKNNEDCYLVSRFGRSLETQFTNLPEDYAPPPHHEIGYGMLVADGMGGPAAGEVASRSAIQGLVQMVLDTPDWILCAQGLYLEAVMARMAERFREIDRMLFERSRETPAHLGMGTTLTLACNLGLDLLVCHVGDSRAYLYRDGRLQQLTRDMTLIQDLIETGVVDPEERRFHRMRHVLTQCLGAGIAQPDVCYRRLHDKDRLLLCTDGLTEMLHDTQIADVLRHVADVEEACLTLVDYALAAGGRDNVTAALADFRVT